MRVWQRIATVLAGVAGVLVSTGGGSGGHRG